jgi:capsular polysaccharide biosynthesis protein
MPTIKPLLRKLLKGKQKVLAFNFVRLFPFLFIDTDELKQICRKYGDLFYFGESFVFTVTKPESPSNTISEFEQATGEYYLPKPFVGVVNNANLIGPFPFVIFDKKIIIEATVSIPITALNLYYTVQKVVEDGIRSALFDGRQSIECGVLLYNCWNSGYYHWVTENLTRLEGVEKFEECCGTKPKLIVGPELSSFQRETLELLGYEADDLIQWNTSIAKVDTLVIPSVRRAYNPGQLSPVDYSWLRNKMQSAVRERVDMTQFSSKVYISRDDADRRRVTNESELFGELEKHGFERYQLEYMDTAETIALMMQADIIVGPHGAGLTDIIYASDADVVELSKETPNSRAYFTLANQVGLDYHHVPGKSDGTDIVAPVQSVVDILKTAECR